MALSMDSARSSIAADGKRSSIAGCGQIAAVTTLVRRVLAVALVVILVGCTGTGEEDDYVERPVEDLYNEAMDLLEASDHRAAAEAFEEVERQHPYSQWAVRAQWMAGFAYYEGGHYDEAVAAMRNFIDLHPGHENVPYAQYLIGVSYYERISDVGRDQEMTERAHGAFRELVRRYPDSDYARDAELKIDLVRDHLAGKEMEIGRFYQQRQQWVAAINRFRRVVEEYETTTHVPEALHRLTESYLALGVRQEARQAAAVLGHNYPDSRWYQRSFALLEGEGLEPEETGGIGSWLSGVL